jgi:hypothetical protein
MNVIGSWKHPQWIEFDERTYWEEKGLITDEPYIPYPVKTEEELWMESLKKNSPQAPLNGFAPNVRVTTEKKFQSLILQIRNLLLGKKRHHLPL